MELSLNVLVIGDDKAKSIPRILKSKYLKKLYANFEYPNATTIRFNTFRELGEKCKALKIDIVFVEDEKLIFQGIIDVLRLNFINCIGLTSKWADLILSNKFANEMTQKYGIKTPEKFSYPKEFPLIVKADGYTAKAGSVDEMIKIRQTIFNHSAEIANTIFLEKYIKGAEYTLTSLFDGKTVLTLPDKNLSEKIITQYSKKLETMFTGEKANFIGYINSKIILSKNQLYNLKFDLSFPAMQEFDILFVFNSIIYQKLDELGFLFRINPF